MFALIQYGMMITAGYVSMIMHNKICKRPLQENAVSKTAFYTAINFCLLAIQMKVLSKLTNFACPELIENVLASAPIWTVLHFLIWMIFLPVAITVFLPAAYSRSLEKCLQAPIPYYAATVGAVFFSKAIRCKMYGINFEFSETLHYFTTTSGFGKYGLLFIIALLGAPIIICILKKTKLSKRVFYLFEQMDAQVIKKRFEQFSAYETRRVIVRFSLAFLSVFSIAFTCLIYGPMDVFLNNLDAFGFVLSDFIFIFLGISVGISVIFALILSRFKGGFFDYTIAFVTAISFALYIQGTFMNIKLGALDGQKIDWGAHSVYAIINTLIWLIIIAAALFLCKKVKDIWRDLTVIIPISIMLIQVTAGGFAVANSPTSAFVFSHEPTRILDGSEQLVVSSNKNIIVIVMDHFSNTTLDEIIDQYPGALDAFEDFTCFTNYNTMFLGTKPSLINMLTGLPFDPTYSPKQYITNAWGGDSANTFYGLLKKNDYIVNAYSDYLLFDPGLAKDKLNNLVNVKAVDYDVDTAKVIKKLSMISFYRYAPFVEKKLFWTDTPSDLFTINYEKVTANTYLNYTFFEQLKSQKLSAADGPNRLIFKHLVGTHTICNTDENCAYSPNTTSAQCGKGCLLLVEEYMNQLNDMGLYDDATIILTSDHGDWDWKRFQPILFIKRPYEEKEKVEFNNAPICQIDFASTVMDCIGEKDSYNFGTSAFDIPKDQPRERSMILRIYNKQYPQVSKREKNNVYNVYTYIGDKYELEKHKPGPTEVYPMDGTFY